MLRLISRVQASVTHHQSLYCADDIRFGKASNTLLQSNQVKRTPQDCINELII